MVRLSPARHVSPLAILALLVATVSGCPTDESAEVVKIEREALEKAQNALSGVLKKTESALAKGGFENEMLFYRHHIKQLSDSAREVTKADVQAGAGPSATVEAKEEAGIGTLFFVTLPRKGADKGLEGLAKKAGALWVRSATLSADSVKLILVPWPGSPASLARARQGGAPQFRDIQLSVDLKPYRVDPKHTPQPANQALFDTVKRTYLDLEKKQNKLLKQGHSQGVRLLSESASTFTQGVALLPFFSREFAILEKEPALFSTASLEPGPNEIRIEANLAPGVTIEIARKRALATEHKMRGDAPASKDVLGQFSWERNNGFTLIPVPKNFALPQGFTFDAPTQAPTPTPTQAPNAPASQPAK